MYTQLLSAQALYSRLNLILVCLTATKLESFILPMLSPDLANAAISIRCVCIS
jgi:hypothetical protein